MSETGESTKSSGSGEQNRQHEENIQHPHPHRRRRPRRSRRRNRITAKRPQVAVVEGASELAEMGAEIQIPPNSSRILKSWRLEEKLLEKVVVPNNMIL